MAEIQDLYQTADWKKEKHAPVIEAPDTVKKGETVQVSASVGKEIAHPNTTEHFIGWIELSFLPKDEKFSHDLGRFEFNAHGASVKGPNTSTIYTDPSISVNFKTEKPGTLIATSFCNIHGLWIDQKEISVE